MLRERPATQLPAPMLTAWARQTPVERESGAVLAAVADQPAPSPAHARHALAHARSDLEKRALKLLGYLAVAYLLLRLLPTLRQSVQSLERMRWEWLVAALAIMIVSEFGFVVSWRAVVDPGNLLERDGRGARTATRAAWAQLGGGMVLPGGSLASMGVGAWILGHFGISAKTIAERQFNLSLLNTAVSALALIVFGLGLAVGIFPGEDNLLLTLLPAGVAALGIVAARPIAGRAASYAAPLQSKRPKVAVSIVSLTDAVAATGQLLFHRGGLRSVLGAIGYLGFDVLVLWIAFSAIHAHPIPSFPVVMMAYVIGALGASIPLPAGIGAVGGIAGMLLVYGVGHRAAVAAVLIYEAVGLLVPLTGGTVAYLILRREFGPLQTPQKEGGGTSQRSQ
jgi:uncharacterized membrane protein YbhN (UPF0104 family)